MVQQSRNITLHSAVKQADFETVRQMISDGANVNEIDDLHFTPLHRAANVGTTEILQFLLWKGADPMIVTDRGWTAVHIAAIRGHEACVQSLADHRVCLSTQDNNGLSPGHLAAIHGNSSSLLALLRAGADVETTDIHGWTMLHCAAFHGRLGCVQLLLRWGFRLDDTDKGGNTAAHLAAMEGHLPVLKCLVSLMRRPLHQLNMPNDFGDTAETLANRFYKDDIVEYLNNWKTGKLSLLGSEEFSKMAFPAHIAAYNGDLNCLMDLVEEGCVKVDEKDEQGSTLLHKAAEQGHIKLVQWLLTNGADPLITNQLGETPAEMARRFDHPDVVQLLRPSKLTTDLDECASVASSPLSEFNLGFTVSEIRTDVAGDREAGLDRARRKIEKLQRLLRLATLDYKRLGGELSTEVVEEGKKFQDDQCELESCKSQLEHERLQRERLEAQLKKTQDEATSLIAHLTELPLTFVPRETTSQDTKTRKKSKRRKNNGSKFDHKTMPQYDTCTPTQGVRSKRSS